MTIVKGVRQVISRIDFRGAKFEDKSTLLSITGLNSQDPLVQAKIVKAEEKLLKRMWAKGYLAGAVSHDVVTSENGVSLIFKIFRGPLYQIYIQGPQAFTASYLRQNLITLSAIEGLGKSSLRQLKRKITRFYKDQGFWFSKVELKDVPAFGEWQQTSDRVLVISIQEGSQTYVDVVRIRGAVAKKHQELTASVWRQLQEDNENARLKEHFRPNQFQDMLTGDRPQETEDVTKIFDDKVILTPSGIKESRLFLEKLYREDGFLFIQVARPDIEHDEKSSRAALVFHIKEGQKMHVGSISVRPSPPFALGAFLRETQIVPGQPLNYFAIEETRLRLLKLFEENGYPWVKVAERLMPVPNKQVLDVFFDVSPGPYVTIGDIQIEGAIVTDEKVIRERIVLAKGEAFNRAAIETSRMNLLQLGVFSQVNIEIDDIERGPTMRDIHVEVQERPQVTLEAGVGASLEDGPRTFTNFAYRNIAGKGLALKGRFQVNYPAVFFPLGFLYNPDRIETLLQRFSDAELQNPLSLSEGQAIVAMSYPRIPDWAWNTGAHVDWNTVRDIRWAFTMNRTSLLMGLFTNPTQGFHLRPQGEMEFTFFDCAVEGRELGQSCGEESIDRTQKQESGTIALGTLRLMTLWDQRDDPFQPHKGYMISTTMETTTGNGELDSGGATPTMVMLRQWQFDPLWQGHRCRFIFFYLWHRVSRWLKI